ncbi:MAG: hypothetical protein AVDCRST_MAG57-3041, partial [uncultured Blastococcus sp.]
MPPRVVLTSRTPANPQEGTMIELHGLTKRYGDKTVVDDLTFTIAPGV